MFCLNKDFQQEEFLCTNLSVLNFLDDNDIKVIDNYIKKHNSFKINAVTFNDELHNNTPSFLQYDNKPNSDYRNSTVVWMNNPTDEETKNLYKKISSQILEINENHIKYALTDIEALQYTIYEKGQFYKKHLDCSEKLGRGKLQRKVSFSIQLSDENDYEGGDLLIYDQEEPKVALKKKGSATFFSSFTLHEVTPVTKGRRIALVGWVWGPRFV